MENESEQKLIEKYLKQYALEDCLDEVLNQVLTDRPINPYTAISQSIELKTLPEILDIHLFSVLLEDEYGVKVTLDTSIGIFHGQALYPSSLSLLGGSTQPSSQSNPPPTQQQQESNSNDHHSSSHENDHMMKDYTILEQALREKLIPMNPKETKKIDEVITSINLIQPAESLAVSIAITKAAAKFHGMKFYEYIAYQSNLRSSEMMIPLPVITLLKRDFGYLAGGQVIQLFPVKTTDLDLAIEKLRRLCKHLSKHKKIMLPRRYSESGTFCLEATANIEEVLQIVKEVLVELDLERELKVGIHFGAQHLLKANDQGGFVSSYQIEPNAVKSGQDLVERWLTIWQEYDIISLENLIVSKDSQALKYLKKRAQETAYDVRSAGDKGGNKLTYCLKGVGGDSDCNLQVIADAGDLLNKGTEIEKSAAELPFNALSICWSQLSTISQGLLLVEKGRKLGWPIILKSVPGSLDEAEIDFAVGAGACQLHLQGLYRAETAIKLTRLQELKREKDTLVYAGPQFRPSSSNI